MQTFKNNTNYNEILAYQSFTQAVMLLVQVINVVTEFAKKFSPFVANKPAGSCHTPIPWVDVDTV